ncbi:MAG: DUF4347 domain-containing protein, partial [Gammaproteobacteria bacterium]|nr:DUF4347 domain-containing protein [Gammaproteobacteria bacterium]
MAPIVEALEPRILFSADLFGGALDAPDANDPLADQLDAAVSLLEIPPQEQQTRQAEDSLEEPTSQTEQPDQLVDSSTTAEPQRTELVLVDTATDNYQQLLDDLLTQTDANRHLEVVLLDSELSGIDQISETLLAYQNLDAIHLISHGSDGIINIGNTALNSELLNQSRVEITAWSEALNEQGDLLIYGCNLAASEAGQSFINTLAQLTGADIAASDDLTGHATQGGDWDLEIQTGAIESPIVVSEAVQDDWYGTLAAPTDIVFNDGATINDGATDGYVGVDQFNYGATASTELTFEISFASTTISPGEVDFVSYAVSSASINEINFWMNPSGTVSLTIGGSNIEFTGFNGTALFDGVQHQLSVTWDSATGDTRLYSEGELAGSETFHIGNVISWASGADTSTLLIGQEQDSLGGGFNYRQIFSGDIFEVRIYDDVRTAQEIADNTNTFLDDPTVDTNLIANWRMADNGSGGITDETGNGNDFTLVNSVSFNTTLSVREDAGSGDHVAFVIDVTDADVGDTHTFGLTDDAGGAFAINATTGEITVADASQLDYETATTMNITVRATDSGAETYDEVVTINIMNVAENAAGDSYSTSEDDILNVARIGVLGNDDTGVVTAPETAGHTLSFDAANDSDATWNNDSATVFDWSIGNFGTDVTHTNSPTTAYSGITAAYQFTGVGGATTSPFEDLPSGDPTSSSASFEIWFRPEVLSGEQMLFETGGNDKGTCLYLDGTNLVFNTDASSAIPITVDLNSIYVDPTAEFIQVLATIDLTGNEAELYVDGVSRGTVALTKTDWAGGDGSGLGMVNNQSVRGSGNFNGDIAVFRFYESVLTSTEVTANYESIAGGAQVIEVDGNPASVGSQVALASGALLTMNADGSFSYDPNGQFDYLMAGESTMDDFAYTYDDGTGGTDTATVSITVNGVNDTPTLVAIAANDTLTENTDTTSAAVFSTVTIDPIETGDDIASAQLTIAGGIENTDTLTINGTAITGLGSDSSGAITGGHSYSYTQATGVVTIAFAGSTNAAA